VEPVKLQTRPSSVEWSIKRFVGSFELNFNWNLKNPGSQRMYSAKKHQTKNPNNFAKENARLNSMNGGERHNNNGIYE
jgi:hypothetical protein